MEISVLLVPRREGREVEVPGRERESEKDREAKKERKIKTDRERLIDKYRQGQRQKEIETQGRFGKRKIKRKGQVVT